MVDIICKAHGETGTVELLGSDVCEKCFEEYESEVDTLGKETLMSIHAAVGSSLKKTLKDKEAFNLLKVVTDSEIVDVVATYNRIVNDVCKKIAMN